MSNTVSPSATYVAKPNRFWRHKVTGDKRPGYGRCPSPESDWELCEQGYIVWNRRSGSVPSTGSVVYATEGQAEKAAGHMNGHG